MDGVQEGRMEPTTPTDPPRIAGFTHLGDVIDELLDDFELDVEQEIEKHGGFRGHVRPTQHRLSWTLDQLAHGRDLDSLTTEAQE